MIFRRSNDTASKNTPASNQRSTQPQQPTRREPQLGNSRPAYQPGVSPTLAAQPTAPTQQLTPVSPLAMAQARRTSANSPMASFNQRNEQMRKLTVGRDISLNGEITTCDHLIVEGTVTATIKGGQILEISESGTFSGEVDIDQAEIAGTFNGDLIVRSKLTLRPTANVNGTIRYGSLQVDTGAMLTGEIMPLPATMTQSSTTAPSYTQTAAEAPSQTSSNYEMSSVLQQSGFLKASA